MKLSQFMVVVCAIFAFLLMYWFLGWVGGV